MRLKGGLGSVANAGRDGVADANDAAAWEATALRTAVLRVNLAQQQQITYREARGALFHCWEERPHTARVLVHRPGEFAEWIPTVFGWGHGPEDDREDREAFGKRVWRIFAWTADALWEYVQSDSAGARALRSQEPLIARTRFLALSEPFRAPGLWGADWKSASEPGRVFGYCTGVELIRRAREARENWHAYLTEYQSVPLLDHAPPFAVEEDVRSLAFASEYSGPPLVLADPAGPTDPAPHPAARPTDRAAVEDVIENHLLPRFAVLETWSAVVGPRWRWRELPQVLLFGTLGGAVLALTVAVAAVFADGAAGTWYIAAAIAALVYGMSSGGTLAYGRQWAMPLMLRFPAAAVVGLIVLVAFHPDWWTNLSFGWEVFCASAVIVGAPLGYLLTQVRTHNSGQPPEQDGGVPVWRRVAARAGLAAVTGVVHAFLVALLGMVAVAPVFTEDGDRLRTVWSGGAHASASGPASASGGSTRPPREPGSPAAILVLSTAVCLAAGVFSQILWHDEPVTAPLSHRRWRAER